MAATGPVKEVSYVELLTLKNAHVEALQQRKAIMADTLASIQAHKSCASLSMELLADLIDDVILDVCFDVHRKAKIDSPVCHVCRQACDAVTGGDVVSSSAVETMAFDCDHCQTQRCRASRYAPHLENCMGFGRRARRGNHGTATAAIAAAAAGSQADADGSRGDDDDDDDFVDGSYLGADGKKRKKTAKGKLAKKPKKGDPMSPDPSTLSVITKSPQGKKGGARSAGAGTPTDPELTLRKFAASLLESKTQPALRQLFEQTCGVLSNSTGKSCNKSVRCSIHTDEQRAMVRSLCLRADFQQTPGASDAASESMAATPTGAGDFDRSDSYSALPEYHSVDSFSPSTLAEVNEYIDIESDGER